MRPRKFYSQFSVATSVENTTEKCYVIVADLHMVVSKILLLKYLMDNSVQNKVHYWNYNCNK